MSGFGEECEDDGLYTVTNSSSTSQAWCETNFAANNWNFLHNYKVDIRTAVWNTYGYPGSIPYKVVIDRDGYLRFADHWLSSAEPIARQCLGVD